MSWQDVLIGGLIGYGVMGVIAVFFCRKIRHEADLWALVAGKYKRELEKIYEVLMLAEQKQDSISEVEYSEGEKHE